jgi:hypothetical protein
MRLLQIKGARSRLSAVKKQDAIRTKQKDRHQAVFPKPAKDFLRARLTQLQRAVYANASPNR